MSDLYARLLELPDIPVADWTRIPNEGELFRDGTDVYMGDGTTAANALTPFGGSGGATNLNGLSDVTLTAPSTGQVLKYNGAQWVNDTDATGGGGVSDGDKGDITVSSGGTVWSIDNDVVTEDMLANVPEFTFRGRDVAGSGNVKNMVVDDACILLDTATDPFLRTSAASGSGLTHPQVMARAQFAAAF